ncbi:MAG: threonine synthase [Anaerolineae bacterium]|nr:threonine synthase [Anaerolineae bacterium]
MPGSPASLLCVSCAAVFPLDDPRWRCRCGGLLDIVFAPRFPLDVIACRPPTMWRYREAIPLPADARIVSLDEGFTPLLPLDFEGRVVWVKQDQLFSTGSYKDRGASVLISQARALGIERVVEDSSGNAGCAIAAYCARAGIACEIYVLASTSPAKMAQIEAYGARLIKVPGSREDTARAVLAAAETTYYASHSWNPFFFHGTKTWAYEVCEQLGWRAPDAVILPVGNGTLLLGAFIGFRDLLRAGVIDRLPRLVGVQAQACAPLHKAFNENSGKNLHIARQPTVAEGIAIADPVRGPQIVRAVRESGGWFIAVDEAEIQAALHAMWRRGFYIEPTAAAAMAGVSQYVRTVAAGELIVSTFTGHGLKAAGH